MGRTKYKELDDSGTGSIINGKDQIWEMLWMGKIKYGKNKESIRTWRYNVHEALVIGRIRYGKDQEWEG